MRKIDEIRRRLGNLRDTPYTQASLGAEVGLPQSAISQIASGGRDLSYEEALKILPRLWPDDPFDTGEHAVERRVNAEWEEAVEALLYGTPLAAASELILTEILPAIREEMRAARLAGLDPKASGRTASRLLWQRPASRARVQ